jgi:hypothetical protein
MQLLFSFLPVIEWFNTFERSLPMLLSVCIALVMHLSIHGFLLIKIGSVTTKNKGFFLVLFSFVMYPALLLLLVAFRQWKDDKWALSLFVKRCFASATLILFLGSLMVTVWVDNFAGAVCFVATVISMFGMVKLATWATNGYYLPRRWSVASLVVLLLWHLSVSWLPACLSSTRSL